jgi:hypothetical protein
MSSSGAPGHSSSSSSSSAAAGGAGGSSAPSSSALADGGAAKKRKGGGGGGKPESSVFVVTYSDCSCYGKEAVNDVIGVFSHAEVARGTARTHFFKKCPYAFEGWVFRGDNNDAEAGAAAGGGIPVPLKPTNVKSESMRSILREAVVTFYFNGKSGAETLFDGGDFHEKWDEDDGTGIIWVDDECCQHSNTVTITKFSSASFVQKDLPPIRALKELGKEGWSSGK